MTDAARPDSIRNAGWSGATRRSSSSVESGPTPPKKAPTLPFPFLQVGTQQRWLLLVGDLGGREVLGAPADAEAARPLARRFFTHWTSPRGATPR